MHKSSWDDLRYILAVADAGSVASAARHLGVTHSTVLRRIASFESRHEVRLFERLASGYALTAAGADTVASVREIDARIADVERRVAGADLRPEGRLRLTTTDSILKALLCPHLPAFNQAFPRIDIDVMVTGGRLDLGRREADIALRPSDEPPDDLVGIEVSRLGFGIYASPAYLRGRARTALTAHRWLVLGDEFRHARPAMWMVENVPPAQVVFRADSFVALAEGAQAGLGVALLPLCLGEQSVHLRRVEAPVTAAQTRLWMLTRRDLRRSATVRAFIDFYVPRLRAASLEQVPP